VQAVHATESTADDQNISGDSLMVMSIAWIFAIRCTTRFLNMRGIRRTEVAPSIG
jgi:hypothetical protein